MKRWIKTKNRYMWEKKYIVGRLDASIFGEKINNESLEYIHHKINKRIKKRIKNDPVNEKLYNSIKNFINSKIKKIE